MVCTYVIEAAQNSHVRGSTQGKNTFPRSRRDRKAGVLFEQDQDNVMDRLFSQYEGILAKR